MNPLYSYFANKHIRLFQNIMQVLVVQQLYFTCSVFKQSRINDSLAGYWSVGPSVYLFQGLFKIRMIGHGGFYLYTVQSGSAP